MYNHNKAQQSKKPCAYFLGYTVYAAREGDELTCVFDMCLRHTSKNIDRQWDVRDN